MSNDYRAYVECDYNSIYHHGVKGMKWGVRRYQNKDGTLIDEKKRKKRTSQKDLFVAPEGQKKNRSSMVLNALGLDDNKKRHAVQDVTLALTHPVMYRMKKSLELAQKTKSTPSKNKKKANSNKTQDTFVSKLKSRYGKVKKENPKWIKDNFGNDSFKSIMNNDPDLLDMALDEYDLEKKSKRRTK